MKHPAHPQTVIFGCGNILMGDDGFGPAVIEALKKRHLPPTTLCIDAGTGIREHLLDLLLQPEDRPERVVIIDVMNRPGIHPGTLQENDPLNLPAEKTHDFSLHQFPTVNLLQELSRETDTRITLLTAQIGKIPDAVHPGLSNEVAAAVPIACAHIQQIFQEHLSSCQEDMA